jgi:hypothetical protein
MGALWPNHVDAATLLGFFEEPFNPLHVLDKGGGAPDTPSAASGREPSNRFPRTVGSAAAA